MSYGFSHYDKKSYKESKKRRKQALVAAETGRILPYASTRRKVTIVLVVTVIVVALVAGGFAFASYLSKSENANQTEDVYKVSSEELLRLVNKANPLDKEYVPQLKEVDSVKINALIYDDLQGFIAKAKEKGIELKINSAYISFEEQQKLYEEKLNGLLQNPDYTQVRAEATAQKIVPRGGESEFQTGLMLEFNLTDAETTSFLERECVNYGFILRYPKDKESVTSVAHNNAIYRYVGVENAVNMRSFNMCLEEYNEYLSQQVG